MKRELKERLERLGPAQGIDRVSSGSPETLRLSRKVERPRTIDATLALAKRGLTLLKAKRAIEAVIQNGVHEVDVPTVENLWLLANELSEAGFRVERVISTGAMDVAALLLTLRDRLELTQEQFARRYNLDPDSIRNWEQGRSKPDRATVSYLNVIARHPEVAADAQFEAITQ
jgi:putative transcriptional regulator